MNLRRLMCIMAVMICILHPAAVTADWKNSGDLKVAVLDLLSRVESENIDVITLTEMLQADLAEKQAFQVVERGMLSKILGEQKLGMMGLTEREASKIGALAGAQKIITGSVSKIGDRYVLLVKGIDTGTGVVELTDQATARDVNGLVNAIPLVAERIVRKAKGEKVEISFSPPREEATVLEERFIDNRNGWSIGDWDAAAAAIKDRQYVIAMKTQAPLFYSKIDVALDPGKNFSVEATVAKLSGDNGESAYYGIIFGKDFRNMYEYSVHPNGRYMIRRQTNGETSFVQASAVSAHVNRGNTANTFKIVKEGDTIQFFLNGHAMNKDRAGSLITNVNLVGYEVWRTAGENMKIAGKDIIVRQAE